MSVILSRDQLATWQKLQDVTELLRREVGRDLWDDAGLSDTEFTVLAHVAASGPTRPSECARSIGWDSSRMAHQLRRLEKRGFMTSSAGAEAGVGADRRAMSIALTDAGRTAYRRALGPHLRSARRWFGDVLTDEQLAGLTDALDALLAHGTRLGSTRTKKEAGRR